MWHFHSARATQYGAPRAVRHLLIPLHIFGDITVYYGKGFFPAIGQLAPSPSRYLVTEFANGYIGNGNWLSLVMAILAH